MYTNLSLYYLQQMGITPWVSKSTCRLLVFVPAQLSAKAEQLFKKILACIAIPEDEILAVRIQQQSDFNAIHSKTPAAVLALGLDLQNLTCNCPIIATLSPEYLLQHAKEKKQVFHDLHQVNALLA